MSQAEDFDTFYSEKKSDETKTKHMFRKHAYSCNFMPFCDCRTENFSHKIKMFVLFLSSFFFFFFFWGGRGRKSYIDGTTQNHRADAILRSIHNLP